MFLSAFLHTSTCLPCCGCLGAGCLFSCGRAGRLAATTSILRPFGGFHWPLSLWSWGSWKSFPLSLWLKLKLLWTWTEGLRVLDILSHSSQNSNWEYKSASLGRKALSWSQGLKFESPIKILSDHCQMFVYPEEKWINSLQSFVDYSIYYSAIHELKFIRCEGTAHCFIR